jgi:hypothetical protein
MGEFGTNNILEIYSRPDYCGLSTGFTIVGKHKVPSDIKVSSIRVAPGYVAIVYDNDGRYDILQGEIPDLSATLTQRPKPIFLYTDDIHASNLDNVISEIEIRPLNSSSGSLGLLTTAVKCRYMPIQSSESLATYIPSTDLVLGGNRPVYTISFNMNLRTKSPQIIFSLTTLDNKVTAYLKVETNGRLRYYHNIRNGRNRILPVQIPAPPLAPGQLVNFTVIVNGNKLTLYINYKSVVQSTGAFALVDKQQTQRLSFSGNVTISNLYAIPHALTITEVQKYMGSD